MPDMRKESEKKAENKQKTTSDESFFGQVLPMKAANGAALNPGECTYVCVQQLNFHRFGQIEGAKIDAVLRSEIENKAMTAQDLMTTFGIKSGHLVTEKWSEPESDDENPDLINVKNAEKS